MSAILLADGLNQIAEPMMRGLTQKFTNVSLFGRILRFIRVDGFAYQYGEQATLGSVAFRAIGEQYTDTKAGVINPRSEQLGVFGGELDIDQQLAAKNGGAIRTNGILAKIRRAGLFYDRAVIYGNPATNLKEFYGLKARLNPTGAQVVSCGTNGAAMTLDLLDELLDRVLGPDEKKVLIMNKWHRRKLRKLLNGAGGARPIDLASDVPNYRGAKIEVLDEDGDEVVILDWNESWGNSSVTSSIYCVLPGSDTEGEYMQGLIGTTPPSSGNVPAVPANGSVAIGVYSGGINGTQIRDIVEMHGGLGLFHGRAAARLAGITKV